MSMFEIAKYLEINRSVDGVRGTGRPLRLPRWRRNGVGHEAVPPDRPETGEARDERPAGRTSRGPLARCGGHLLF